MSHVATPLNNPACSTMESTDPTTRRFRGSAKISEYEVMKEKLGEGTFGVVSKARSKRTSKIFALKKILMHNEKEGFPITALREVKLLKMLSHPNILRLEEMAVERMAADEKGSKGRKKATLYMVTPYMDHDLSGMLTNPDINFSMGQIKCYMLQLLEGLRYLHDSHILHRDMKAANILISNTGILQIADFGLARHYDGETPQPGRGNGHAVRDYTSLVVTRWYRPPELLLTLKRYTPAIDLWGVGCVFGEMFETKPILEGRTDVDQCVRIFKLVGSPDEQSMPGWSDLPGCEGHKDWPPGKGDIDERFGRRMGAEGLDLLKKLLCLDWRTRINAVDALQHNFFKVAPLPMRAEDIPRYEDSHELDSRRRGNQEKNRALPPAPAGGTVGMGPDEWNGNGPMNGNYQGGGGRGNYDYDRQARGPPGGGRDRGPPPGRGPPPRGYEERPRGGGGQPIPSGREPEWQRAQDGRGPPPPPRSGMPMNGHSLPPRPMDLPSRPEPPPPARGPPPPIAAGGGGAARVDTYIPAYQGGGERGGSVGYDSRPPPPPPRDRDRERDRGDSRPRDVYIPPVGGRDSRDRDLHREGSYDTSRSYREADVPPPRSYRDVDSAPGSRPPPMRDGRDAYRERERDLPRERERERDMGRDRERGRGSYEREERGLGGRSRSPDRMRERDRERERERGMEPRESRDRRERLQEREREMYRR
ncbi:unnamed protein product [Zymoseptoria tritici ST99CH_3D1]|uniref:Protein kinase domain-containing protein n=1 Tax=Zymoseptoria tritici ST99CH_1E4 TaxID=1276532 RepID=A0A2H1GT59_ZYMTR|nr:unnamed protein product [Zymoseptoria tritici ST99CH_1E4]SMR59570.1 unnamed protein product [Zymoseptoria tritici ST99CH_3D1]